MGPTLMSSTEVTVPEPFLRIGFKADKLQNVRVSSLPLATRLQGILVQISLGQTDFFLLSGIPTGCGGNPALYSWVPSVLSSRADHSSVSQPSPGGKAAGT
jgi:hypothetical protein